jgi:hypothetical protein
MLAACGDKSSPNTPTEEENRQLDNAAEMLDASPDSMVANEDAPLGNGEVDVVESDDSAVANERSTNSVGNAQ